MGKSQDLPAAGSLSVQALSHPAAGGTGTAGHRARSGPALGTAACRIRLCHRASTPPSPCPSKPGFQRGVPEHPRRGPFFLPAPAVGLTGWTGCTAACGLGRAAGMPGAATSSAEKLCQSGQSSSSPREPPGQPGRRWPRAGEPPAPQPAETCFQPACGGWEGEKEASKAPASAARPPSCRGDGGEAAAAWYGGGGLKSFPPPTAPGLSGGVSSSSRVPACSLLGAFCFFFLFPPARTVINPGCPARGGFYPLFFLFSGRTSPTQAAAARGVRPRSLFKAGLCRLLSLDGGHRRPCRGLAATAAPGASVAAPSGEISPKQTVSRRQTERLGGRCHPAHGAWPRHPAPLCTPSPHPGSVFLSTSFESPLAGQSSTPCCGLCHLQLLFFFPVWVK